MTHNLNDLFYKILKHLLLNAHNIASLHFHYHVKPVFTIICLSDMIIGLLSTCENPLHSFIVHIPAMCSLFSKPNRHAHTFSCLLIPQQQLAFYYHFWVCAKYVLCAKDSFITLLPVFCLVVSCLWDHGILMVNIIF